MNLMKNNTNDRSLQARIDGAKFLIDHVEMGELQSGEMTDDKIEFDVGGFGKEIMIKGPRKYLSLAEVQVIKHSIF